MAARANAENFEELVLKSELPVLVDFYSDSCIPCKMMAGVVGDIEDDFEGKLNVYKVNVNFDESLASKYEVLAAPTFVAFNKGAETGRIAIYYGCADTCVGLAYTTVDAVVDYVKSHSSI